jgi:hypothetical protein
VLVVVSIEIEFPGCSCADKFDLDFLGSRQ